MNTASRMKWTSQPGLIQLSETTFDQLDPKLKSGFTTMEGVEVKVGCEEHARAGGLFQHLW